MKKRVLFISIFLLQSLFLFPAKEVSKIHEAHLSSGWYSQEKEKLNKSIQNYFAKAQKKFPVAANPQLIKALIVPHAGHKFSGLCAASAYQTVKNQSYDRIIILAPSHRANFYGIALPDYDVYRTVLGDISVDKTAVIESPLFNVNARAHALEHSIEIQLPFLQVCLKKFSIIPLIVGKLKDKDFEQVSRVLNKIISDKSKKTLVIVSSDFIHYGPRFNYVKKIQDVRKFDSRAIEAIAQKSFTGFDQVIKETGATICGRSAIKILLKMIEQGAFGDVESRLACCDSSARHEVTKSSGVNYASLVFTQEKLSSLNKSDSLTGYEKHALLKLARDVIYSKLTKKSFLPPILSTGLKQISGAFVTLKTKSGQLRGCIGRIVTNDPLYKTVINMAESAAFRDRRFAPLKKEELNNIVIDISVLTRPQSVKSYKDIVIGKHGIILKKDFRSAVFLPQVPGSFGWDRDTTLEHLSSKAGLKKDGYKKGCTFEVFEGFDFAEKD